MVLKKNSFEGGTDGTNVSTSNSGGLSGDAFNVIVINNASTPSGTSAITFETDAAMQGLVGCRFIPPAGSTYLRWDDVQTGTRFGQKVLFKYASAPTATFALMSMRGAAELVSVNISSDGKPHVYINNVAVTASKPVTALTPGNVYSAETYVTKGSGAATADGVIEFRILDAAGTVIHTWSQTTAVTNINDVSQYRFGGITSASGLTVFDMDSFQGAPMASGFFAALANTAPTVSAGSNQNVSAAAIVNLSATASDPDGSIASHAWTFDFPLTGLPTLTGASTATPSFTAGGLGSLYVLRDTVTDNEGATSFATVEVRVPTATDLAFLELGTTDVGAWTLAGSPVSKAAALNDGLDTTYVEGPASSGVAASFRRRLQPSTARGTGTAIIARVSQDAAGTFTCKARLIEGVTLRQEWTLTVSTTLTDRTLTLDAGTISAITDWGKLFVEFEEVA